MSSAIARRRVDGGESTEASTKPRSGATRRRKKAVEAYTLRQRCIVRRMEDRRMTMMRELGAFVHAASRLPLQSLGT